MKAQIKTTTTTEKKSTKNYLNLLTSFNFEEIKDRLKFTIIYFILGISIVFLGDILIHLTFNASGIIILVFGIIIACAALLVPLISWLNNSY